MEEFLKIKMNSRAELVSLINSMGTNISFENDVWICDLLRQTYTDDVHKYTIYFANISKEYMDWAKLYAIKMCSNLNKIKTIKNNITDIKTFFDFLKNEYGSIDVRNVDYLVMKRYEEYLNEYVSEKTGRHISIDTRHSKWSSVSNFYILFQNYEGDFVFNPVGGNPFEKQRRNKDKYIPPFVCAQLDVLMKDERIPLWYRTYYWIMRMIPSRLNEVLKLKTDFIKKVNDGWVLVLPMWKQNGGYKQPELRPIKIKKDSVEGQYLINNILKQIEVSNSLQQYIKDEKLKGYLFTARKTVYVKSEEGFYYGEYNSPNDILIACEYSIKKFMGNLCKRFNIKKEDGSLYKITTHMLRHTGITDRLSDGFEPIDIRKITGHKNDSMIINNYDHTSDELLLEKQELVLEGENIKDSPILFKGKIMNLNEAIQKRLLRNLRAHKVKYGICSDISDCSNNYECLDGCEYFVPDAEDLQYFEEEVVQWKNKIEVYKKANNTFLLENAEHNLKLHQNVVDNIKKVTGGEK